MSYLKSLQAYFGNLWNIFDLLLIILYVPIFLFDILDYYSDQQYYADKVSRILYIAILFMASIKFCFYIRVYDSFSCMVSLLKGAFWEVRYFLCFYLVFIIQFGLQFTILEDGVILDTYIGVNRFGYFIKSFRVSMGDFDTDSYQTFSRSISITAWIVWVLAVFVLNIILMNFIIALISDAYAKVMQRMDAE